MKGQRAAIGGPAARCLTGVLLAAGLTAAAPATLAVPSPSASAAAQHYNQGKGHGGGSSGGNLIDHGGAVLAASKTFSIFWGPTARFPGDMSAGTHDFLTHLDGSSYLNIASQYMRGSTATITSTSEASDASSSPPVHAPSVSTLVNEVVNVVGTPDPSTVYLIYTSNFPKGGGFCAFHSIGFVGTTPVQVAYLPNVAGVAGCQTSLAGSGYSAATQSQVNDTAHEFMESITDPELNAWFDQSGQEIGDKCETVNSNVTLGTTTWALQKEWSNSSGGCVAG